MIKSVSGGYHPGERTTDSLKAKFTETADCIVLEPRREGKLSTSVGLFHDGELIDIGSVKMRDEDLDKIKPGDVIEVRYLYATLDYRLYQPVWHGFRDDKSPDECTTEQLKFVNKEVRATTQ
jgi:ATP-dependent DNA ligase